MLGLVEFSFGDSRRQYAFLIILFFYLFLKIFFIQQGLDWDTLS